MLVSESKRGQTLKTDYGQWARSQAPAERMHAHIFCGQDVGPLDVAVDDVLFVQVYQALEHLQR